jgi:hypothetical protein
MSLYCSFVFAIPSIHPSYLNESILVLGYIWICGDDAPLALGKRGSIWDGGVWYACQREPTWAPRQQVEPAGMRCEISLWTKGVKDMDPFIFDGCYKNPKRIKQKK